MKAGDKKLKDILQELDVYLPIEKFDKDKSSISTISTGSLLLNDAIGIGGYPSGKIIEIFGVDSSGKTTLALHALAEAQKLGKIAIYIDLENTINLFWAKKVGVDINDFYIARPRSGEETFELIRKLVNSSKVDLIIVDSVTTLVPSCELENSMDDQQMGAHARLMSKGLRILQNAMIGKFTTIIFINQVREKMGGTTFMPMVTTTGGRSLKYAAALRIEVKKCERIQDSSGKVFGFETKCVVVVKNKYGAPMNIAKTAIYFDAGFDQEHEIVCKLLDLKILTKKGSWIEWNGKNLAQGLVQLRSKLKTDQELRNQLRELAFPV